MLRNLVKNSDRSTSCTVAVININHADARGTADK